MRQELEGLLQGQQAKDAAKGEAGGEGATAAGSSAASLVRVVLASLDKAKQQAAAQLSVFPSAFDEESAAALLGLAGPGQAHALLASLYRHNVLQRADSSRGQHMMHMLVRQEAAQLEPEAQQQGATRFGQLMFKRLSEWADMYYLSAKEWTLALLAAREEAVNITAAMELLATVPDPAAVCRYATSRMPTFLDEGLSMLARFEASLGALCQRMLAMCEEGNTETSIQQQQQQGAAATALYMHSQACLSGGDCQRAQEAAQSCVELRQRVLGAEHPDTITAMNNLAFCTDSQGEHEEAEALYRQVLVLRQRLLGAEHLDTFSTVFYLAACIGAQGQHDEAERLQRQALELYERALGAEHPDTITCISNLANCIDSQGQHAEAEPLYRQVLALYERVLGGEHPFTITAIANLALCLDNQGQHAAAEVLYRQALGLSQRVRGAEHPDTIGGIYSLASCLERQERHAEAQQLYQQAEELQ